ncbi:MAG: 3-oxoadipate enol-lactonase 2 [Alphaproteobacteria bacterium UBA4588]|nr:MAG: 3-oxoadipate enol-lactonase 2 [Alphaproteobacteria bacterium UBA4588]
MPYFTLQGVKLHYLDEGEGPALFFLHEFGGDARTWAQQVTAFSQQANTPRRCIVLSARGYLPSDVPADPAAYSWENNRDDAIGLMDHLGLQQVDLIGLSMGAYIALMITLHVPDRIRSTVCASVGAGAHPPFRAAFIDDALASAEYIRATGVMPAREMALAPNRIQLRSKNEAAWQEFLDHLAEHDPVGAANTLAEVQAKRPGLHDFASQLETLEVPVLILAGDEDEPCLDVSLWLKRQMPYSALKLYPRSGHLINLEDPDQFHLDIAQFHDTLADGRWVKRSPTPFTSMFAPVDERLSD